MIISSIQNRFDQPRYRVYSELENKYLLVKAANKQNHKEELEFITKFYDQDFNAEELQAHLSSNIPIDQHVHDLHSVLSYLRDLSDTQKILISQVCKLASLILVMLATNFTIEHSFSALRRIKPTYTLYRDTSQIKQYYDTSCVQGI